MKSIYIGVLCLMSAYSGAVAQVGKGEAVRSKSAVFTSSDKQLEATYDWAKRMALSYVHDGNDPVGVWYEAALPQREAFCMRDVSHQAVGAQILGLSKHNRNMFFRFAENISEEKDWCSYWEINRYNKPAPVDYANDKEFWYNLNANADVVQACLKMYDWTGDKGYLDDPTFVNFYRKSFDCHVPHWQLGPDQVMDRPQYMHQPQPFDPKKSFHTCRGLGSYVENFAGLVVGVDLIATLYAGYRAYATIAELKGESAVAEQANQTADRYNELLETRWWNPATSTYHTFWTSGKTFNSGEGEPFILWFGATKKAERIRATVKSILSQEWNVENLSAFPMLLYRLGYAKEAYEKLIALPHLKRSEYPEVSYGAVEGIVAGLMGVAPKAAQKTIVTLPQLPKESDWAIAKDIPVFNGYVSVKHTGNNSTEFVNNTGETIAWQASFKGKHERLRVGSKKHKASIRTDELGGFVSYANIKLKDGEKRVVRID